MTKKDKEIFDKNLTLGTEFSRYVMEHPEFAEQIPKDALVVLLPEDDPELCEINRKNAEEGREPGQPVVYVRIKKLAPMRERIAKLRLELVPA